MRTLIGLSPSLACLGRGGERVRRAREGDDERVALRIHLDAAVPRESVAQHHPVLAQELGVALPVLAQQPRRALDVREEERNRARRELTHSPIMNRGRAQRPAPRRLHGRGSGAAGSSATPGSSPSASREHVSGSGPRSGIEACEPATSWWRARRSIGVSRLASGWLEQPRLFAWPAHLLREAFDPDPVECACRRVAREPR